jgi:DNA replication and repair protein RecF
VIVSHLALTDFRNYTSASLDLAPGLTVVTGANGQGKTNLVEALSWLATTESFRGVPNAALVRDGATAAVVRATVLHDDGRELLVEAEIPCRGRPRVHVNRQPLQRWRELLGVLRVSVFGPDDLWLVKGAPLQRRRYLDDVLVALHPRHDAARRELERVVKQRTTLLKQASGQLTEDIRLTLEVWDAKLAQVGEGIGSARAALVADLEPLVAKSYEQVARTPAAVQLGYEPPWRTTGLAAALAAARADDLRRQVTSVGPHVDDVEIWLGGLPARTHASQGEHRCLALALRLAQHELVAQRTGTPPVVLLDDVFSELDSDRGRALTQHLPRAQVILTTAGHLPEAAQPGLVVHVRNGVLSHD